MQGHVIHTFMLKRTNDPPVKALLLGIYFIVGSCQLPNRKCKTASIQSSDVFQSILLSKKLLCARITSQPYASVWNFFLAKHDTRSTSRARKEGGDVCRVDAILILVAFTRCATSLTPRASFLCCNNVKRMMWRSERRTIHVDEKPLPRSFKRGSRIDMTSHGLSDGWC